MNNNTEKHNKPNLSLYKVINKFLILCSNSNNKLNNKDKIPVYFANKKNKRYKQPEWILNNNILTPKTAYITVDYDEDEREWHLGYIKSVEQRQFGTVDDVTSECTIHQLKE